MQDEKLNRLIKISILGAVGFLLMFIEVPIPIFPEFLKLDVSDIPALVGGFALGPVAGVIVELIKNIFHGIFKGGTAFVGEAANFLVGSVLVIVSSLVYRRNKNKKNAVLGLVLGTIVMAGVAGILNYYVLLPLYETLLHFPIKAVVALGNKVNPKVTDLNSFILWAIIPFNILKGIVVSAITVSIYKSVSVVINKSENNSKKLANNRL